MVDRADRADRADRGNHSAGTPSIVLRMEFFAAVTKEYRRARQELGHPPMHSLHEGYAVLLEELDEVWEEIKRKHPDAQRLREELTQVATVAMAMAIELLPAVPNGPHEHEHEQEQQEHEGEERDA